MILRPYFTLPLFTIIIFIGMFVECMQPATAVPMEAWARSVTRSLESVAASPTLEEADVTSALPASSCQTRQARTGASCATATSEDPSVLNATKPLALVPVALE